MKIDFEKMVFKPDYVVVYNENGTYSLKALSGNIPSVYVSGYAASKSHPDEPVLVSINIPMNGSCTNVNVYKLDPDTYLKSLYTNTHDLFVYLLPGNAILAGKEMALYDEADRVVNTCKDYVAPITNYFDKIRNNPLYRHIGQGLAEMAKQEFDKHVKDFEPTYDKAKETVKDAYNKTKDTVKTGASKLIDEIYKTSHQTDSVSKSNKYFEKVCTYYKELPNHIKVTLKHYKNTNGKSNLELIIFNSQSNIDDIYYLNAEQFADVYDILFDESSADTFKYNSIMDVVYDIKPISKVHKSTVNTINNECTCKKDRPIQMVNFRPEDEVTSSTLFQHKFKIGDKVQVNKKIRKKYIAYLHQVGTVVNIGSRGTKTLYNVQFTNGISKAFVDLYSNELEKY